MKNSIRWTIVAVVALVSSNAWALFNPDTDGRLKFWANFQTNTSTTTTDAKGGLTGVLVDYNTSGFNVFRSSGIRGISGDFNQVNDANHNGGGGAGNDCGFSFNPNGTDAFEFSDGSDAAGFVGNDQTTLAFWFNMPTIQSGTFFREELPSDTTYNWEVRAVGGKLSFLHSQNCLRFETADLLSNLGITNNTWHHAAVVFDRTNARITSVPTTSMSAKMYLDGAEVPIVVTYYNTNGATIDTWPYSSPLVVGRGERDFDGLLDDVRFYRGALSALEISLIYQNNSIPHTTALLPVPKSSNVAITTDVNWVPATGATAQTMYFGTNPASLVAKKTGNGTINKATNLELSGPFTLNTTYYWYVKSTVGGVDSDSPIWSFTAESGKVFNPGPADGAEGVNVSDVNVSWSGPATASSYDVYYSTNKALVDALDPSVKIATATTALFIPVNTSLRGQLYYWKVVSNYSGGVTVNGDTWSFTTRPYEIVFNTSTAIASYQGNTTIPPLAVVVHANGWFSLKADGNSTTQPGEQDIIGHVGSDGVVIYDFNTFSYDKRFGITVIPTYRGQDITTDVAPRPIAIHVNNGGNFYFDGKIDITGDDLLLTSNDTPRARCGGFVGPRHNSSTTTSAPDNTCWTAMAIAQPYYNRFGTTTSTSQSVYFPNATAYTIFGPGIGTTPPYKGGCGASYGGVGGNCGRGYFFGMNASAPTYGDKEVPVPFGGSGGGWGGTGAGTAGGGGIEIVAAGNVVLDTNSVINANAGDALYSPADYPGGGGSGGSVKIIGNSVTIKGAVSVKGGKGGNTGKQANECGGGGAGGRIAIFGNTINTSAALFDYRGGSKGSFNGSTISLAEDGKSGTFYTANLSSLKKASAPTPKNGDNKFYAATSTIPLKWYSGYGASTDEVYFGTSVGSMTKVGATVAASRGQHTSTVNVTVTPGVTYYFKVISDGAVTSDVWSFKVVNWQCPLAVAGVAGTAHYLAGPVWDNDSDCVVTETDFWYFAKDWRVPRISVGGSSGTQDYTLDFIHYDATVPTTDGGELVRFVNEWLECANRTNSGCTGW